MLTVVTILTAMLITVCAIEPNQVQSVLEFTETKKAYPIADSVDNAIGFFDYYNINVNEGIHFEKPYEDVSFTFTAYRTANSFAINSYINGSYPYFLYEIINGSYNDFAISYDGDNLVVIGFLDGRRVIVNPDLDIDFYNAEGNGSFYFSNLLYDSPTEGYFVDFEETPLNEDITSPITQSLFDFVVRFGGAFLGAFTAIFMFEGSINALGITVLVLFGVVLGYGVIRWITGLFRKES